MDQDEFELIVSEDCKSEAHPQDADWLREEENLKRWMECLLVMKDDIQTQMTSRKATFLEVIQNMSPQGRIARTRKYNSWRERSGRVMQGVEARIRECQRLMEKSGVLAKGEASSSRIGLSDAQIEAILKTADWSKVNTKNKERIVRIYLDSVE